ncbi:MAG: segregation/condensation protein A [Lachnospiraceae bacterium]|nr:segregation/condensation protein A [Lachnospiraceae bacterium]
MALSVKIESFEGPLDLLLHLLDINKFNIFDIPIVEITAQYMEYLTSMKEQDLNVMSEFLVMAATLLEIKARMLLPAEVDEDGEEIDPREELVQKLLEYKMYKYMSYELRDRLSLSGKSLYKGPTIPEEVAKYETPVDLGELVGDLSLIRLNQIFQSIMRRQTEKIDPIRSKFGRIEQEEVSLDEKMVRVREYAAANQQFRFSALLEGQKGRIQLIVTFLAILELMKTGELSVVQEHPFDDILITAQL